MNKLFHSCPKCGSTNIGLTNPDDGDCVCRDCGYHECYYQEDVDCNCSYNENCSEACLLAYMTYEVAEHLRQNYRLPKRFIRGTKK